MRSKRERCPNCEKRRVLGSERICKACSAEYYDGALCSRCDLDLDSWGYCVNDRCPFYCSYQDEAGSIVEPVSDEEWKYITKIAHRRHGSAGDGQ